MQLSAVGRNESNSRLDSLSDRVLFLPKAPLRMMLIACRRLMISILRRA
jgi:hypothetical protein